MFVRFPSSPAIAPSRSRLPSADKDDGDDKMTLVWSFGRYEGQVDGHFRPHGEGVFKHKNGTILSGQFEYGLPKPGCPNKYTFLNKETYVGDVLGEEKHGYGEYTSVDGWSYKGNWAEDERNGKGSFETSEVKYDGEWRDDMKNGIGEEIKKKDGCVYKGEWKDNMKYGVGTFIYPTVYTYEGNFESDQFNGLGKQNFNNGTRYEGYFKNGKRHGQGTWYGGKGEKHVGEYKNGFRNGKGAFYYANGDEYEGNFANDILNGKGRYRYKHGDEYTGDFKSGDMHGTGTFKMADGDDFLAMWEKDKLAQNLEDEKFQPFEAQALEDDNIRNYFKAGDKVTVVAVSRLQKHYICRFQFDRPRPATMFKK